MQQPTAASVLPSKEAGRHQEGWCGQRVQLLLGFATHRSGMGGGGGTSTQSTLGYLLRKIMFNPIVPFTKYAKKKRLKKKVTHFQATGSWSLKAAVR